MKKIINILLVLTLVLTSTFSLSACVDSSTPSAEKYSVGLNQYDIALNVGETFNLSVKKFNSKNEETAIKSIKYLVEADEIASISESGVITAKQTGGTYINVDVDGVEVACFVSVRNSDALNGLVIIFTGKIYQGLPMQAHAFIYEDGVRVATPEQVTFSGSDTLKATISESGLVTGNQVCDDLVISASCTYDGKTYSAEKQVSINAPYYYVLSNTVIKLASTKTLSGKQNQSYSTKSGILVSKINVLDNSDKSTVENISVVIDNTDVASFEVDNGVVSISAKDVIGTATARINVTESNMTVVAKIEVYNAISTIEDMDILAYASLLDSELLAQNFVLVNDIDYENAVILPIASYALTSTANASRVSGEQWRYWFDKTEDGKYLPVARENVYKTGYGLTDEEFGMFKGINPNNTAFKGVFDGNGHSIKNAQIFFGSILLVEGNLACPEFAGIFGKLTGTLKNVSFENISIQDPAELISQGYKFCADGKELRTKEGVYQYRGTAIVGTASQAEISNVYANINYNHRFISNYSKSVLAVEMKDACKVTNCVIESGGIVELGYAITSSLSSDLGEVVKNCLAIGVSRFSKTNISTVGADGNFFVDNTKTWSDLASAKAQDGTTAKDSVYSTFNSAIWDLTAFNYTSGGRPVLIKGCSFA